jgi:HSP20 family protein
MNGIENAKNNGAVTGVLPENVVMPMADIYETPDAFVLSLDMPGASKEAISLRLEKGLLHVSAPFRRLHGTEAEILRREIRATGYRRAFTLGEGIDGSNVQATFEKGVLTVKLYKSAEMKPREIQIH